MKFLSLILLLCCGLAFSMENPIQLDESVMQEFLKYKKQTIRASEGKVDANNPLYKRFVDLCKLDETAALQEFAKPTLQANVSSFYKWLSILPEYQSALAVAKAVNTTEAWDAFRKGNQPLVERYFDANGIKTITTSCADFFNANAHLDAEQVEKVVAQSAVIYAIRNLQRKQTNIAPSEIQIK